MLLFSVPNWQQQRKDASLSDPLSPCNQPILESKKREKSDKIICIKVFVKINSTLT